MSIWRDVVPPCGQTGSLIACQFNSEQDTKALGPLTYRKAQDESDREYLISSKSPSNIFMRYWMGSLL